jgi:hypothetical protein
MAYDTNINNYDIYIGNYTIEVRSYYEQFTDIAIWENDGDDIFNITEINKEELCVNKIYEILKEQNLI